MLTGWLGGSVKELQAISLAQGTPRTIRLKLSSSPSVEIGILYVVE